MLSATHTVKEILRTSNDLLAGHPKGFCAITSIAHPELIEHKPDVVCYAPISVAARCIVKRTHRESTPQEIEAYDADIAARTEECRKQEIERKSASGQIAILQQAAPVPPPPTRLEPAKSNPAKGV